MNRQLIMEMKYDQHKTAREIEQENACRKFLESYLSDLRKFSKEQMKRN
ncbi:hypothetical protein KY311_02595 [Candidatus Woesearchaeota archaeon]|nr:hypothetical protein [Candidatus Woesearchaeota archaeon]MBW3017208.1 hypothetical protein [Candidatus Woesearchaeota archaeon]